MADREITTRVFLTKYVQTEGIETLDPAPGVKVTETNGYLHVTRPGRYLQSYLRNEWTEDAESARDLAKARIERAIVSTKKKLRKLEATLESLEDWEP